MSRFDRANISLRGLQVASVISALIAVVGGGTFVLTGVDGVARVLGTEFPEMRPMLAEAAAAMASEPRVSFDLFYRSLGWYWMMTGGMLFWIIPNIASQTAWFRFIHVAFMAVGMTTLLSIAEHGTNAHLRYANLIPELGVPSTLIVWQTFVARGRS